MDDALILCSYEKTGSLRTINRQKWSERLREFRLNVALSTPERGCAILSADVAFTECLDEKSQFGIYHPLKLKGSRNVTAKNETEFGWVIFDFERSSRFSQFFPLFDIVMKPRSAFFCDKKWLMCDHGKYWQIAKFRAL